MPILPRRITFNKGASQSFQLSGSIYETRMSTFGAQIQRLYNRLLGKDKQFVKN